MAYYYKTGVIVPFVQKFYKQMILVVAGLFIASMGMMTAMSSAVPSSAILITEEFITHDGNYKGISVGFNTSNFTNIVAVDVVLKRADNSTVTKTGNQGVLNLVNSTGPTQLTTPFVIQEGSFTEASDTLYWDPAPAVWTPATAPVKVTINLTDSVGVVTSVENNMFNQGVPSWPTYLSLLKVLGAKEDCKNGNWAIGLANGTTFKNQGQCVSNFASRGVSTTNRNR